MSEEKKLEVVEGGKRELSPNEKQALLQEKIRELQEAGIDPSSLRPPVPPPGMVSGMPGMVPGMPGMTGMLSAPSMAMGRPAPVEPMPMPPEMQQQHPMIKRAPPKANQEVVATQAHDGLVQLSPMMMMEIEVLSAEKRASEAEEKLAMRALQDSRERSMLLLRKESMLLSRITSELGMPPGRSIRLVDKDQRLCKIED